MTTDEIDTALRQFRLSGMADSLTVRAQQARADSLGPMDFLGLLVHDEMERRGDRLIERRIKEADFRDKKTLDTFNWPAMNRSLASSSGVSRSVIAMSGSDRFYCGDPGRGLIPGRLRRRINVG